jgi:serine/threonine-protein kinase
MRIGRYEVLDVIAKGGMATVHLGRLEGAAGFSRPVAIKRLHPHLARDPAFVAALADEARIASRIAHPNVVAPLDVIEDGGEVIVVYEYVRGCSLAALLGRTGAVPHPIGIAIVIDLLEGLGAAHAAGIVHRDVSPQNTMVGTDGRARVLDFGIALARGRLQPETEAGKVKGKLAYMAPEQAMLDTATPQSDIYSAGVVLWELLAGERFRQPPQAPSGNETLDLVTLRALEHHAKKRWATAAEFAAALRASCDVAPTSEVARWIEPLAKGELERLSALAPGSEPPQEPRIPVDPDATTRSDATAPPRRSRAALYAIALGIALIAAAAVHASACGR